jgi:galactokinase
MGKTIDLSSMDFSASAEKALTRLYGKQGLEEAKQRYAALGTALLAEKPDATPIFVSAPGRTELGGNHTDHNHGRVLAAALRFDAVAAAVPSGDSLVSVRSAGYEPIRVDLKELEIQAGEKGSTASLVRGVAAYLRDKGYAIGGFTASIDSAVPAGSGMSSSACVEVLFGAIFSHLFNSGSVSWTELALAGQYAENHYFGKPCGLMDQMASAGGGILTIDFSDPQRPEWERLQFDFEKAGYSLAIVATGGTHADLTADYAAIPEEMKTVAKLFGRETLRGLNERELLGRAIEIRAGAGDRAFLRALHFIQENERVPRMVKALKKANEKKSALKKYFARVNDSGRSSWTYLQNVDSGKNPREQNLAVALAMTQSIIGKKGAARVHGGGFAGTIQAYIPNNEVKAYTETMEAAFGPGSVLFPGLRKDGVIKVF